MADDADAAGQLTNVDPTPMITTDEYAPAGAIDPEPTDGSDAGVLEDLSPAADADHAETADPCPPGNTRSAVPTAMLVGLAVVVGLAMLAGWLGIRLYHVQHTQTGRNVYVQVGRQAALNLTTIDWQNADADVRRIVDGATGQFYDDFSQRSQPFIDVVKQTKSTTVGTVTEAALESETPGTAQVLVAVTVKTTNAAVPDQQPRAWRMRISVQQVGDQPKVSNVEFVP